MKIPMHYLKILTIAILIGLIVFSVLALILKVFISEFDPTAYITAIALLAIAVLTVVYVISSSGQLEVLKKQLIELEKNRKLESQPLPITALSLVTLEPPRFFCNPADDTHSFHTRIRVDFSIRNHTSFPAVNVITSAAIVLNGIKKPIIIRCSPTQLDLLAANENYPPEEQRLPDFVLSAEKDDEILAHLQKKTADLLPLLPIHIVYSNILGACFSVNVTFRLSPMKQEEEETLKKWHSATVSFPVEYKDDLKDLDRLKKEQKDAQWKKQFNALQKKLVEAVGSDELELAWERLPNSFKVRLISQEEYDEELKNTGFGEKETIQPEPEEE